MCYYLSIGVFIYFVMMLTGRGYDAEKTASIKGFDLMESRYGAERMHCLLEILDCIIVIFLWVVPVGKVLLNRLVKE